MTATPVLWSQHIPGLQLAWDATSLRQLMKCEVLWDLSIRQGWRGTGVDVEFGSLYAGAVEHGWKARAMGSSVEEAQMVSLEWALKNSVTRAPAGEALPWGGQYLDQWKCFGSLPWHNAAGNRAKCPNAFARVWHDGPKPDLCGICGDRTFSLRRWLPFDPAKNRKTLIRTVVWYWEEQAAEGGLEVVSLEDGRPAVELSFCIPSGYKASTGEDFLLCGHLDSIKRFRDMAFICDNKTTRKSLGMDYFSGFSPDVQVDLYDLAGSIMLPELRLQGVLIEAAQVGAGGSSFALHPLYRTEEQREEFHNELGRWFAKAEALAQGEPVHNRSTCWLCGFRGVCSKTAAERPRWLEAGFKQQHWNPLAIR